MKIEIKRWDNNEIIICGEYESVRNCLERNKDKSFYRANLSFANLSSANLSSANLSFAKNLNKYITTPLYSMLDQIGNIRAYKLVNKDNEGVYNGGLIYKVGETIEEKDANTNENESCAKGINLATLDWCVKEWKKGYKILIAEFTKDDIACIPIGSDGKFRVFRCKIVGKKPLKDCGIETKCPSPPKKSVS